jgi:dihydromonapterin reductase/dihydrofolate reductase
MSGTVLITGGARRFGRALSLALAAQGYSVIITYRQNSHDLASLENAGVHCIQADFSNAESTNHFIETFKRDFTDLRALIHNASEWLPESASLPPEEVLSRNLAIHVQTPYLLNLGLEDLLRKGADNHDLADIIHMTDYVATRGSSKHIAYAASKAALHNMSCSFAGRLAPQVKVNSIAPALLIFRDEDDARYRTKVAGKSLLPPGPGAEEGINTVLMLLASRYITGQSIALDGGRHLKQG